MSKLMPTKWSGKEIGVTIGYAFLLVLCYFASDCLGFLGPFFWVYGVPIMLLIAGIPYFYIAAREQRYGTFTIVGVLFLLYGLLSGALSNPPYLICVLIGLICPDLIRMVMGYDSFAGTLVSYLAFAIARIGAQLNIWLMPAWCHDTAIEEMGEDYADALVYNNAGALKCVIFLVATLLAAVIGAYIAKAVLRKPLTKYGMLKGAAAPKAPKEA
ncbi:MAG: MptD family putative ECF transporter S component [Eubacteriales bacterium]|nr:MptD family putative ECF transporter S component [Eubacteriales bacterium]